MYKGFRFPREIISHCVWLYHRFTLSFREIELLMLARGIEVTYETIRKWCARFGPKYARRLRRRQPRAGDKWHLDEVFIDVAGVRKYLWRAVDQHGNVLDILVQSRRNAVAAKRFFRKLFKGLLRAARAGHRPAGQLPGRPPRAHVVGGASAIEIPEQQGRELPPTDPSAGTLDKRIPLRRLSPEVPCLLQSDLPTLPTISASDDRHRPPSRNGYPIPGVESGHRTGPSSLTTDT
jgi:putative transposase